MSGRRDPPGSSTRKDTKKSSRQAYWKRKNRYKDRLERENAKLLKTLYKKEKQIALMDRDYEKKCLTKEKTNLELLKVLTEKGKMVDDLLGKLKEQNTKNKTQQESYRNKLIIKEHDITNLKLKLYKESNNSKCLCKACQMCGEREGTMYVFNCGHLPFCKTCEAKIFSEHKPKCPICNKPIWVQHPLKWGGIIVNNKIL